MSFCVGQVIFPPRELKYVSLQSNGILVWRRAGALPLNNHLLVPRQKVGYVPGVGSEDLPPS